LSTENFPYKANLAFFEEVIFTYMGIQACKYALQDDKLEVKVTT
jgi:hypothetical protein